MKIKVCGMRNIKNVSELICLPINYIGFIFYNKSPRFVENENANDIIEIIPSHIKKVGVFVNADEQYILEKSILFDLQCIQLHGNESPDFCKKIKSITHKEIIKAFGIDESFDFNKLKNYQTTCDKFLFDTKSSKHGGTGRKFDWNILNNYSLEKKFLLSGGIELNDAEAIKKINHPNMFALDLNSKFETEPALKDINLIKEFISQF